MRGRRGLLVSISIVCALMLSACTPAVPPAHLAASDTAAAHRQFGQPAIPAPKGFTYQPDVRIVGGGRNAVISGTADGTTWTLDADAPGMSDVRVGDVLWATSYVAGRVLALRRTASTAVATIMPVPITDVIRDGTINVNTGLSASNMTTQQRGAGEAIEVAPLPSTSTSTGGAAGTVAPAAIISRSGAGADTSSWADPKPGFNSGVDSTIKEFEVSAAYAPDGLNLTVGKNFDGVKLAIDFGMHWRGLRFRSLTSIVKGSVTDSSTSLQGLQSLTATLTGGAASAAASIPRLRIEIPFTQQIQIDELPPLVVQFKISFIVGATFGGKNATILARGVWRLDGDAGTENGKVVKPTFGVEKSIIDSITGISLGATGLVFAMSMRALVGVGVPGLAIGPYAKIGVSIGIANGSALGAPLVRCRSATLDVNVAAGAAFDVSDQFPTFLSKAGSKYIDKIKNAVGAWAEETQSVVSRTQTVPDVPLCTSG